MRAGRVVAIVVGCVLALLGLGMLVAGIAGTVAYGVAQDDDGFFRTDEIDLATPTSAITSDSLDLGGSPGDADWLTERGDFATVTLDLRPGARLRRSSPGSDPPTMSQTYLASVAQSTASATTTTRTRPSATNAKTARRPRRCQVTRRSGSPRSRRRSPARSTWDVQGGDWTVVIMNADASPGIDTNARVGIKIDWLLPVAIVLIVVGVVMLVGGILLAVFVGRRPRQQPLLSPCRRIHPAAASRSGHVDDQPRAASTRAPASDGPTMNSSPR